MLQVILYQPEIPPNTGNIIRLCANTGTRLHLIEPLGFDLDTAKVRRAGLDYHELSEVHTHRSWSAFRDRNPEIPVWAFSTRGTIRYSDVRFRAGDGLLFGPETRGLPADLLGSLGGDRVLRLPMQKQSRSINLSNTVAAGLFEALRQLGFEGLE
jgi:tRNA (cytidine/uridine-2'-O-)-methyltransferase